MSNFHSVLSRRQFMQALGLAGAGLGVAAGAPIFHDLDEAIGSSSSILKRPWYVKERDIENPVVEIDWSKMQRPDARYTTHSPSLVARYVGGVDAYNALNTKSADLASQALKSSTSGFSLRDNALSIGSANFFSKAAYTKYPYPPAGSSSSGCMWNAADFMKASTPDSLGVTSWQGTPEENTKMLRAAMRFYGAADIAVGELNTNTMKMVHLYPQGGPTTYYKSWPPPDTQLKRIVFENVERGYTDTTKYVIPQGSNGTKKLYCISYSMCETKDMWRYAPSNLTAATNGSRYRLRSQTDNATKMFLAALGFQGLEEPYPCIPSLAGAVMDGLAEPARNSNVGISPDFGSVHGYYDIITDLPLAPTHPIDAGMYRFCHTCHKCANACPSGAISQDSETSWDPPQSTLDMKRDPTLLPGQREPEYSSLGKKIFWTDQPRCSVVPLSITGGCPGICMGVCTFNVNGASMVHDIVKGTLATTPLFNSFLWKMDNSFGYGLKADKEEWWNLAMPIYGFDTTVGSTVGGYPK